MDPSPSSWRGPCLTLPSPARGGGLGRGRGDNQICAVIPTLNAAATIPLLVEQLRACTLVKEVTVVDGGSSDETVAIARAAGAQIVAAPCGRGIQLAAGADAASGDWLLFLHADCRLAPGWEAALTAFTAAPEVPRRAGYFDFALDDATPAARRLERNRNNRRGGGLPRSEEHTSELPSHFNLVCRLLLVQKKRHPRT